MGADNAASQKSKPRPNKFTFSPDPAVASSIEFKFPAGQRDDMIARGLRGEVIECLESRVGDLRTDYGIKFSEVSCSSASSENYISSDRAGSRRDRKDFRGSIQSC
jgi:hypothetical protein